MMAFGVNRRRRRLGKTGVELELSPLTRSYKIYTMNHKKHAPTQSFCDNFAMSGPLRKSLKISELAGSPATTVRQHRSAAGFLANISAESVLLSAHFPGAMGSRSLFVFL